MIDPEIQILLDQKQDTILTGMPVPQDGKLGDLRTNVPHGGKFYNMMKAGEGMWLYSAPYSRVPSIHTMDDYLLKSGGAMLDNSLIDAYDVKVRNDLTTNGNYALEGYSIGRSVIRSFTVKFDPGATPNTNVDCVEGGWDSFNLPSFTNATNLAASGSSGSFSMSADGKTITLDLTEAVVGIISITSRLQNLNSSSTTEMYFPNVGITGGNLTYTIRKRGSVSLVDWRTILDAGDQIVVTAVVITSS